MRIALEALGLIPGKVGGMETYVRNLISGLTRFNTAHDYLLLIGHEAEGTFRGASRTLEEFVADTSMPPWCGRSRYCQSAWHLAAIVKKLKSWKHDVLHCMMTLPKPPWGAKHMVLTIHDLNFEFLPDLWGRGQALAMRTFCRLGARVAEKIITDSHYTKQSIADRYGVPEHRIEVVYLGIDREMFSPDLGETVAAEALAQFQLPENFILFPANTWPHKNHPRLLRALAILRDEYRLAPYLVLTGAERQGHARMLETMANLRLEERVRWLGYVARHELAALYRRAHALVFPSLYEGFGIPVVEAMASGCPVACARIGATGEVAGGAAMTFDPASPADIAESIAKVLTNEELRRDLVARGLERAAAFSSNRMVRETLRVYEHIGSANSGLGMGLA